MKGYYLFAPVEPACAGPQSGIERKIRAQHKALARHLDCKLVIWEPAKYTQSPAERIIRRLPFTAAWRKWEYRGEFDDADFLYIRQVYHDASFVRWLRALKRTNPKVKIIYEVPTWPYGADAKYTLSNFPFLWKDRHFCRRAAKYFDRIVTFYNQDRIWDIPCLKLLNGYDFSSAKLPLRQDSTDISLISVSQTAFWHGYDRVIEGLRRYYASGGRENIVYHMVGSIDPAHQDMVREYGLEDHVIFHGSQFGDALAAVYSQARIGIDVLGGHRIDYPVSSSLKSREYGAYGIPLVTSSPVDYMAQDDPFQLIVPYDDSPLDIPELIRFYHRIYDGQPIAEVSQSIREAAMRHCDMAITMKPVADYLLDNVQRKD